VKPASFAARVVAWQRTHGRHDLPWQRTRDAYRIWLSEIMLQQTQVATALPYYLRFVAAFPDVRALAQAPLARVLELWSGLGYYRRAHHLHAAAKAVVERHHGAFPREAAILAELPGIGRSTAAAIATFAGGSPAPILDGNVKRVLARHAGIGGHPGARAGENVLWRLAGDRLPERGAAAYTQGLMDLGATVCTRRSPRCDVCPVAGDCVARERGEVATIPAPRPTRRLPHRSVRVLLIERAGSLLLERRPATGIWGGLWSLPETPPAEDVVRHCRTRFGARVVAGATLPSIEHGFTHFRLTIVPQRVAVRAWPLRAHAPGVAWFAPDAIDRAALPAPIRRLLAARDPAATEPATR
jgi:A/G-specific adenine glycosylase